jgi:hypothetical protein
LVQLCVCFGVTALLLLLLPLLLLQMIQRRSEIRQQSLGLAAKYGRK